MKYSYKQEFLDWVKKNQVVVLDTLPDCHLRKGYMVMFTNDYGITFGAYEVLGFTTNGKVYFDHSSYWFPIRPEQITPAEDYHEKEVQQ